MHGSIYTHWEIGSDRQKYVRLVALLLLLVLLIALFVLGAKPFAVQLFPTPLDKLAHLLLFAVLAMLSGAVAGLLPLCRGGVLLLALGCTLAVGAVDELHQAVLPGRSAGWDDFAFDLAGALYGLWVLLRLGLAR